MTTVGHGNIEDNTECEACHELDLTGNRELNCSLSELEVSACDCNSCSTVLAAAKLKLGDDLEAQDVRIRVFDHSISNFVDADTALVLEIRLEGRLTHQLELYTSEEHTLWKSLRRKPFVPPATHGFKSLRQVLGWLEHCGNEHLLCKLVEVPQLPTRVLEIFEADDGVIKVRLVESADARKLYVCLSHCWGQAQVCCTTRDNVDQHKQNIPMESCSRVFREAIIYTWALGFRYLWIDSLCIIQDDDKDWQHQSSMMASIYQNAVLTLAASKAPSGNEGMFVYNNNVIIEIDLFNDPSRSYKVHMRDRIYHVGRRSDATADYMPLLNRGWVYQERLLSKRVLHFGPQELFWECAESMKCQCTALNSAMHATSYEDSNYGVNINSQHARALISGRREVFFDGFAASTMQELNNLPARPEYLPVRWRNMVTEYSVLSLTKPSDRLPAFSGVAQQMQRYRESKYLAGLWEDTFFKDLLWLPSPVDAGRRQTLWQAPSWSWASMACAVRWAGSEAHLRQVEGTDQSIAVMVGGLGGTMETVGGTAQLLQGNSCILLEASCLPVAANVHGAISSGFARIEGYLLCITENVLATLSPGCRSLFGLHLLVNSVESLHYVSDDVFWADDGGKITCPHELYLLRIGCTEFIAEYHEWSLLVRCVDDVCMTFERCGIVSCLNHDFRREQSKWFGHLDSITTCTLI